jgi:hypothetical protein
MPDGGVKLVLLAAPNKPTIIAPSTLVVTDGATALVDAVELTPPECARIGDAVSTPEYATIPPDAACELDNVHIYDGGSEPLASLQYTAWRSVNPLISIRIRFHPACAVIVGFPRAPTNATITSPDCTPDGTGIVSEVDVGFAAEDADRNEI